MHLFGRGWKGKGRQRERGEREGRRKQAKGDGTRKVGKETLFQIGKMERWQPTCLPLFFNRYIPNFLAE